MLLNNNHLTIQRKGYTLIEVMVVMSVLLVILGMAFYLLKLLLQSQHQDLKILAARKSLVSLITQLRSDVHQSQQPPVITTHNAQQLTLTLGETVRYEWQLDAEPELARELIVIRKFNNLQEMYRLPAKNISLNIHDRGKQQHLVVHIDRPVPNIQQQNFQGSYPLQILAVWKQQQFRAMTAL